MARHRNTSDKGVRYRLLFNNGDIKICKSDASYSRYIRNNDLSQIHAVYYNNTRQDKEYIA